MSDLNKSWPLPATLVPLSGREKGETGAGNWQAAPVEALKKQLEEEEPQRMGGSYRELPQKQMGSFPLKHHPKACKSWLNVKRSPQMRSNIMLSAQAV